MVTSVASTSPLDGTPPIAFMVAVWMGTPREDILRGLAEGWIARPPGTLPGWTPPGWNDDTPSLIGDDGPATAPSRQSVEGWLRSIDPTLADDPLEKLWQSAGGDDAARGRWWRGYLQRALGVADEKSGRDSAALDAAIGEASADPANRATIVSLADRPGTAIAELANGDAGIRYALAQMDPVALTGNRALAALRDRTGEFDRFDSDTGERVLTDAFIADRAKFVAWKLRRDAGGDLAIAGDARWTFVDRARVGDDGAPFALTLEGERAGPSAATHEVVFGTASADVIAGGSVDDRLYGGGGDDFVRGGGGSDQIEGGRGADTLVGGRGGDQLVGGAGADELDGGSGVDGVAGGSGDDMIAGGRGDDTLDGGAGDDMYVFDGGDGRDVIVDADGRGHVVLDDVEITGAGAERGSDGVWRSADGALEYRYSGTIDDRGVLSIRLVGEGSTGADEIRIRGWQNGALGITLTDLPSSVDGGEFDRTAAPEVILPGDVVDEVEAEPAEVSPGDGPPDVDVASMLVAPDIIDTALRSFAGVSEPPDVTSALNAWDGAGIGVTAHHLSSAMLDFHDSGDLAMDQAASEPNPVLVAVMPTTEGISIASLPMPGRSGSELVAGQGIGQRR